MNYLICGKHTVISAYKNNRAKKIYIKNKDDINLFKNIKIEEKELSFFKKNFELNNIAHQGFAAEVAPIVKYDLNKMILNQNIKLVALQGIEDQRNIGAIIRSCAAFEVDGVIIENKNFNESSLLMNKAHAGNIEFVKLITVSNIINVIKKLKKNNFTIYCLDKNSNSEIKGYHFDQKSLLIFGNESSGIKNYIKKECDHILSIKISKKVESLNLSNAVAITLSCL